MLNLIAEQPVIVAIALGVLGFGLLIAWLQTGKRPAAIAGVIVLLLIPAEFVLASQWQTSREEIREMILSTADAIERNDFEAATAVIAEDEVRRRALSELGRFDFDVARMTGERSITVNASAVPISAEADVMVRVEVTGRGIGSAKIPRRLILDLQKFGDQWKVVGYQHLPVVGGPDLYSNIRPDDNP